MAVTTGAISIAITCTALIVACLSLAIQLAVYYCFYMPKLMSIGRNSRTCNQRGSATGNTTGSGGVVLYDVVDGSVDEETTLEMEENEAYNFKKRVGRLRMNQTEAYDTTTTTDQS